MRSGGPTDPPGVATNAACVAANPRLAPRVALVGRLLMAAAIGVAVPGWSAEQRIRAEVRHPTATAERIGDPDVAMFTLEFDIRLTNLSGKIIQVPDPDAGGNDLTRTGIINVQYRRADGTWAYLIRGVPVVHPVQAQYPPCKSLPPGRTEEMTGLSYPHGLMVLKEKLPDVNSPATIRLDLYFCCRQLDGEVPLEGATTDEFVVRLPPDSEP